MSTNLLHLESATDFKTTIDTAGETPIICDIWASWCGPCMRVAPTFEELAGDFEGHVIFAKLNADAAGMSCKILACDLSPHSCCSKMEQKWTA